MSFILDNEVAVLDPHGSNVGSENPYNNGTATICPFPKQPILFYLNKLRF